MRRVLHFVTGMVLFLGLLMAAGYVLYATLPGVGRFDQLMDVVRAHRWWALEGAAVTLLVVLLYLLTGIPARDREKFLAFEGSGGSVSISVNAIRDFLARLGDEFAAVLALKPNLRASGSSLQVELDIKVRAGTQIPELCRMLQDRVKETIRDNLGLSEVGPVQVKVREIAAAPTRKRSELPDVGGAVAP